MPEITLDTSAVISGHLDATRLEHYWDALQAENQVVNLVSRETTREGFDRMVAECLLPFHVKQFQFASYLDIGSGGGMPSVPILLSRPEPVETVLIERTGKKAAALQRILDTLTLPAELVAKNLDEVNLSSKFDLVTLRYVKLSPRLLSQIQGLMSDSGSFVYYSTPEFKIKHMHVVTHTFSTSQSDVEKSFTVLTTNR